MSRLTSLLQLSHAASLAPAHRRFVRAAMQPATEQQRRLRAIVAACGDSDYGRHVGLDRVNGLDALQRIVPIAKYADIAPYIDRAAAGEPGVLTSGPIRFFERTSGSSATKKLIPFTRGALRDISAATSPWLSDLHRSVPSLRGTRSYWAISPATRTASHTAGGIPIGAPSDREYFGALGRRALGHLMAVEDRVGRITDVDAWSLETCRQLLAAGDLGFLSVWSPSFLLLLMQKIEATLPDVLPTLKPARAREIRERLDGAGRVTGEALWPRLALISCWADADSAAFIRDVAQRFPYTPIQPKGLLATEGVVTIPLWGQFGAVTAVTGHVLEFLDLDDRDARPRLLHELTPGASYSPLLTTRAGLLRYHLPDVVECIGFWRRLPRLVFRGRLDRVSDLCGEKLDPAQVETALEATGLEYEFALVAPSPGPPAHYVLYVGTSVDEARLTRAGALLDERLRETVHYDYCRRLGQLGPVRTVRVSAGLDTYRRALLDEGRRLGDIKPSLLDQRLDWSKVFR